jgi:hypothetical protein
MRRASTLLVVPLLVLAGCAAPSGPAASPLRTGIVANAGPPALARQLAVLSPPLVRLEFDISAAPERIRPYVDAYATVGSGVLLLAGFYGRLPSEDEARGLGRWAKAFGPGSGQQPPVTAIEFGNETSYSDQYGDAPGDASFSQRARTYALRAATASEAVRAADPGVGLLVQGDDANTGRSDWVDEMFAAVPNLGDLVAGWTVHPYGQRYEDRLARAREQLGSHGGEGPLWVTEWGLAIDPTRCVQDNQGWNPCMTESEGARILREVTAVLPKYDVAAILVYQGEDQRPLGSDQNPQHYYGVLTTSGRSKGEYTDAVRELLEVQTLSGGGR